jgi:hypothetical protein
VAVTDMQGTLNRAQGSVTGFRPVQQALDLNPFIRERCQMHDVTKYSAESDRPAGGGGGRTQPGGGVLIGMSLPRREQKKKHLKIKNVILNQLPLPWSTSQSSWLQIQRSGFDSRRYHIF